MYIVLPWLQVDVTVAGLHGTDPVVCSRNVVVKPDASLDSVANKDFDAIVLPGGMKGAQSLAAVSFYSPLDWE